MVSEFRQTIGKHLDRSRLLDVAKQIIAVPSPTGDAGRAADLLAEILTRAGFAVERPPAGHAKAPAVVTRLDSGKPGRTLQFNGHIDTVHLPFVEPGIEDGLLTGSGAADMKGGIAAAVEALFALRESGALRAGSVLLTVHDLHEAPWGHGEQLDRLITEGYKGDGVLLPEPLSDRLPVVGRGQSCWRIDVRRSGPPVHEVMRPVDAPHVLLIAAELVGRLQKLDERLAAEGETAAGRASVFVGQIHGGQIYNQLPQDCWLEGTRRWLPGTSRTDVEAEFRDIVGRLEAESGATLDLNYQLVRDAFHLDEQDTLVDAFQKAFQATSESGQPLKTGPKPFVDDGNSFCGLAGIPAITYGPLAGGQHTIEEWVSIDDMMRVATLYALTAVAFCARG